MTLCIMSGALERHRWQEQGVLSWVWLLFVEPLQLWKLRGPEDLAWDHNKEPWKEAWWCEPRPPAVPSAVEG